jgi:hypothetical protein
VKLRRPTALSKKTVTEAGPHVPPVRTGLPAWLTALLALAAAVVLAAVLLLIVLHADDRFGLDHASGTRIALARSFDEGTLYPPLYDAQHYGGSRFMPLPIMVHGLIAKATGEFVISGRVLGVAAMTGLLILLFVMVRKAGAPTAIGLALVAAVVTTRVGLFGTFDLRSDALPLLLQLGAVALVAFGGRARWDVVAAALAALAFVSKLSAIWAPLAIMIWLLLRDRGRLWRFAVAYVAFAVGLLLTFNVLTGGRIFENVLGLSTAGITGLDSIVRAPYRFINLLVGEAAGLWALVPFAAVAAWLAVERRELTLSLVSLIAASGVVLVVLTDVGTGRNQLIDVVVLTALVVGELAGQWKRSPDQKRPDRAMSLALVITLLWVTGSGLAVTLAPEVQAAAGGERTYDVEPLAGVATPSTRVLSEDPYVPVTLGQTPVVLDPFMLLRIGSKAPRAIPDLVERIEAREFDLVVLLFRIEDAEPGWYQEVHFGPMVIDAISRSYVYARKVQGYYLYAPRPRGQGG